MRPYTLKLAAGARENIAASGDYVRVHSAAGEVLIENAETGSTAYLRRGGTVRFGVGQGFDTIDVTNVEAVEQTIVIYVGKGGAIEQDSEPVINGGSIPIIEPVYATQVESSVMVAANAKKLTIKNEVVAGGGQSRCRIRFSQTVGAAFYLEVGESYSVDNILIGPEGLEILLLSSGISTIKVISWV